MRESANVNDKYQPSILTNKKVPAIIDILSVYAIGLTTQKNDLNGLRGKKLEKRKRFPQRKFIIT